MLGIGESTYRLVRSSSTGPTKEGRLSSLVIVSHKVSKQEETSCKLIYHDELLASQSLVRNFLLKTAFNFTAATKFPSVHP